MGRRPLLRDEYDFIQPGPVLTQSRTRRVLSRIANAVFVLPPGTAKMTCCQPGIARNLALQDARPDNIRESHSPSPKKTFHQYDNTPGPVTVVCNQDS